jgi:hypothetical protein
MRSGRQRELPIWNDILQIYRKTRIMNVPVLRSSFGSVRQWNVKCCLEGST